MDAYRCLMTKRDLRSYAARPIPEDVLLKILEAGRRSGSALNRQPWEFVVVTEAARRRRLARTGRVAAHLATAQAVIVIVVPSAGNLFDAGRAAQSIMLAAWSQGVASCPVTLHHDADAREVLGLGPDRIVAIAIALGYPHPGGRRPIERLALRLVAGRGRKPLASLVHWDRYGTRAP